MISQGCIEILKVTMLSLLSKVSDLRLVSGDDTRAFAVCVYVSVWLVCIYATVNVCPTCILTFFRSSVIWHLLKTFWNTSWKIRALFHPYTSCLQVLPCGFWVPGGQPWLWAFPAAHPRLGCENNRTHIPTSPLPDTTSEVRLPALHLLHSLIHSSCHAFALERDRNLRPSSVENEVRRQKEIHLHSCFIPFLKFFLIESRVAFQRLYKYLTLDFFAFPYEI